MKGAIWLAVGLLGMNTAVAAPSCMKEMAGQKACVAGEQMICNKEFDSGLHDFRYEWHGLNSSGQAFDINFNPVYKKVPGLTPAACAETSGLQAGSRPQIGAIRGKIARN